MLHDDGDDDDTDTHQTMYTYNIDTQIVMPHMFLEVSFQEGGDIACRFLRAKMGQL